MCGLVGIFGSDITRKEWNLFGDLLYVDALRGEDSTGVASVKADGSFSTLKSVGPTNDFLIEHGNKLAVKSSFKHIAIIGHNRAATRGKVTVENAHPFEFEHVVGAHNGSLLMWDLRELTNGKVHDVDSKILFDHLNATGSLDDITKATKGAMALTWWDRRTMRLNLFRNELRPLFYTIVNEGKNLVWASESWMLHSMCYRNSIKVDKVYELTPHRHHEFDISESGLVTHSSKEVAAYVEPTYKNSYTNYGGNKGYEGFFEDWDKWEKDKDKKDAQKGQSNIINGLYHITSINPDVAGPWALAKHNASDFEMIVYLDPHKLQEIQNKIMGRGKSALYLCPWSNIKFNSVQGEYWTNFSNLTWQRPSVKKQEQSAPWYVPNLRLPKTVYLGKVECGCYNCNNIAKWEDKDELVWISAEDYFCRECQGIPWVKEFIEYKPKENAA